MIAEFQASSILTNTYLLMSIGWYMVHSVGLWDQVYCTDQARNDFWELAGGLPVIARSSGRLGLRLGLLYSRKAGLIRPPGQKPESDPMTHAIMTGPG